MIWLRSFNSWYDQMQEPWRFLFFLVVFMGWVPLVESNGEYMVIGTVWMCFTTAFAFYRNWR